MEREKEDRQKERMTLKRKTERERENDESPMKKCDHVESIDLCDYKSFQPKLCPQEDISTRNVSPLEPGLAQVCYFQESLPSAAPMSQSAIIAPLCFIWTSWTSWDLFVSWKSL